MSLNPTRPEGGPPAHLLTGRDHVLEWLQSGRLTLLDAQRRPVDADRWRTLPADVRQQAQTEFARVVSPNAKAAILFLR